MNTTNDDPENLFDVLQGGPTGNPYTVTVRKDSSGQHTWDLAEPEKIYFAQPLCEGSIEEEIETATEEIVQTAWRISNVDLYARASMIRAFSSSKSAPFASAIEQLRFFPRINVCGDIHFGTRMLCDKNPSESEQSCSKIYACNSAPVDDLMNVVKNKLAEACALYPSASEKVIRLLTAFRDLKHILSCEADTSEGNAVMEDCLVRLKDASAALVQAATLKPRKRHPKTGKRIKFPGMFSVEEFAELLTKVGKRAVVKKKGENVVERRTIGVMTPVALRKLESRHKDPSHLDTRFDYCKAFRLEAKYKVQLMNSVKAWQKRSIAFEKALNNYMTLHPNNKLSSYRPEKKVVLVKDGNIERRSRASIG